MLRFFHPTRVEYTMNIVDNIEVSTHNRPRSPERRWTKTQESSYKQLSCMLYLHLYSYMQSNTTSPQNTPIVILMKLLIISKQLAHNTMRLLLGFTIQTHTRLYKGVFSMWYYAGTKNPCYLIMPGEYSEVVCHSSLSSNTILSPPRETRNYSHFPS